MEIKIRCATAADFEDVHRLLHEVHTLHVENEPKMFREPPDGVLWTIEHYLEIIADENQVIFLAEADGAPAGFAHVVRREAPPLPIYAPRCSAVVDTICVTAARRGCGLGQGLIEHAETWARTQDATALDLGVYTFNRAAIAFYERQGITALMQRMTKLLE